MSEQTQQPEDQDLTEEDMMKAMSEMTPEQMEEMKVNMEKMQQEQLEKAKQQQEEEIKMLATILTDFVPVFKEYVTKAIRTESKMEPFKNENINPRLAHAALGVVTELNELSKAVQLQDKVNIAEELGDIFWYVAIGEDTVHFLDDVEFTFDTLKSIMTGEDKTYSEDTIDLLKRALFYNKVFEPKDFVNPLRSIFIGVVINSLKLGVDLSEILDTNLKKLYTRYPEKFEEELAVLRDLDKERETLEDAAK